MGLVEVRREGAVGWGSGAGEVGRGKGAGEGVSVFGLLCAWIDK